MFDSKTLPDDSYAIKTTLTKTTEGYVLTLTPDSAWMNDPTRVYPITIDPTVTTTKSAANITDTYTHSGDSGGDHNLSAPIKVGETEGASCRGYVKVATLPTIDMDTNDVLGGDFIAYLYEGTSTRHNMTIYRIESSWNSTTMNWASRPTNSSAISDTTGELSGNYYKYTFPIDVTIRGWFKGVYSNYGTLVRYTDESINDYNYIKSFKITAWTAN